MLAPNGRYFTDGTGKAVYLTGSHTWTNLIDAAGGCLPSAEGAFDYLRYLDWLRRYNHNFIRLWRIELTRFDDCGSPVRTGPHPWRRTGPGRALDGLPRFDLTRLDERYFSRLRGRVKLARDRGLYVSIMLFNGWDLRFGGAWKWRGHPFNIRNNVNGIDGDVNRDGVGSEVHSLVSPPVVAIEEAYVRKVVDTVNAFDNVLYEVANEAGANSTRWQYHVIRMIKRYEATKPMQHPVGMTFEHPDGNNSSLVASPADWISPRDTRVGIDFRRATGFTAVVLCIGGVLSLILGRRRRTRAAAVTAFATAAAVAIAWALPGRLRIEQRQFVYLSSPPPATGAKVVLSDTDHHCGVCGDASFVWRNFLRGYNPIYMDPIDEDPVHEAARWAMGDTLRFAQRLDLIHMSPRPRLASTGYVLASSGAEYLVYQPARGPFSVELVPARYSVEWFDTRRRIALAGKVVTAHGTTEFRPPFEAPAVLHLRRV